MLRLIGYIISFIAIPIASSQIIGNLASGNYDTAKVAALVFVGLSLCLTIILPLAKHVGLISENIAYLRNCKNYMRCLVNTDMEYFNSNLSGYLTTAMRQYADSSTMIVRSLKDRYLGSILRVLLPLVVISFINTGLGLIVLLLTALQVGFMFWSSKRLDPYRRVSRERYRDTSGFISDVISNIITVKSTAQESNYLGQVERYSDSENIAFLERFNAQNKQFLAREIFTVMFIAVLVLLVIHQSVSGDMSIASAVLVIGYLNTILMGVGSLADDFAEHDDHIDKILPALRLINRKNNIIDPAKPIAIGRAKGRLEFKDVSFRYNDKNGKVDVLKGFQLTIPAGQKLGIVGLSGAGKSTLAKLVLRFNDVTEGDVLLDGVDIRSLRQNDLRRNIAYVPQEPLLFHDSVRRNLSSVRQDVSEDEMISALKSAYAWEFVEKFSDKLDSVVGERGVKLSGGQKQRIAIARAILQDAPIVILDEATSALDSESEQMIKKSFSTILKNKTSIVIAHRLSTLSEMDRIVVLDNGKLIEDGSHRQLLELNGVYAKLWKHQQWVFNDCEVSEEKS